MSYWKIGLILGAMLAWSVGLPTASAQQLNPQQIQLIKDTAASICNTVGEAKGQKSNLQIEGDVKAQLSGLVGKVVDVGGSAKGSLTREEFEGLSRDATATAMEGDRGCRERVFNKMFDKLGSVAAISPRTFGACIGNGGGPGCATCTYHCADRNLNSPVIAATG